MNTPLIPSGKTGFRSLLVVAALLLGTLAARANPVIQSVSSPRQVVPLGRSLVLNAAATGSGQFSYQWWRSGRAIPGATAASYTINDARPWKDAGWYDVVVTDANGSSISAPIFVNVATAPHTILTWGVDDWGHGPGEIVARNLSESVGVTALAVGGYYAGDYMLALRDDGTVNTWGFSDFGALEVPAALNNNVVAVAAGGTGVAALKADGTVVIWGFQQVFADNLAKAVRDLTGVVGVAAPSYVYSGGPALAALKQDGTVVMYFVRSVPGAGNGVVELTTMMWPGLSDAVAISAGGTFVAALRADGTVVLSSGGLAASAVSGLTGLTSISAGYDYVVGLKADGTVVAVGNDNNGWIAPPAGLSDVVSVAAGPNAAQILAIKSDGTVVAWGPPNRAAAVAPAMAREVSLVAGGGYFSIALRTQTVVPVDTTPSSPASGGTPGTAPSGTGSTGTGGTSSGSGSAPSGGGGAVSPWFLMSMALAWLVRRRQRMGSGPVPT